MGLKAGVIFSPSYFMHHLSKEKEKTFSYFSFEKLLSNILFCKKKIRNSKLFKFIFTFVECFSLDAQKYRSKTLLLNFYIAQAETTSLDKLYRLGNFFNFNLKAYFSKCSGRINFLKPIHY